MVSGWVMAKAARGLRMLADRRRNARAGTLLAGRPGLVTAQRDHVVEAGHGRPSSTLARLAHMLTWRGMPDFALRRALSSLGRRISGKPRQGVEVELPCV